MCRTFSRLLLFLAVALCLETSWAGSASEILKETGIRGGLVVHVGCGDGKQVGLTARLRRYGRCQRAVVYGASGWERCLYGREVSANDGVYHGRDRQS
ncbi:hypothetical protein ACFL1X_11905 [Candidatus Hydrogenedentota bacterium]